MEIKDFQIHSLRHFIISDKENISTVQTKRKKKKHIRIMVNIPEV